VRILNHFCDCFIRLGPNFTILEPGTRLAATLLYPAGKSLQGLNFCDYLASNHDRAQFFGAIARSTKKTNTSETTHVNLMDVQGRSFPVQIHFTGFPYDNDQLGHLIGIVEPAERLQAEAEEVPTTLGRSYVLERSPEGVFKSGTTESSEWSDDSMQSMLHEVAVWLVETADGYMVKTGSPGFVSLSGPIEPDQDFVEWMPKKDAGAFHSVVTRKLAIILGRVPIAGLPDSKLSYKRL